MSNHLFTSVPSIANSKELNIIVTQIIKSKLRSIMSQVGEQLEIDLNHEIANLNKPNDGMINPALFHYYFKLKEVIESGNLTEILDVMSLVAHTPVYINKEDPNQPNITSVINSEWEKSLFDQTARKEKISQFGMENNIEIIHPVFGAAMQSQKKHVIDALDVLFRTDKTHYQSCLDPLVSIKLFDGTIRGFSYQAAYGNIYIKIPKNNENPVAYYLEHIVHEAAHQHLFALQLLDPVVLNDKSELYDAPIRIQKRPMDGIFHACFVLSRMLRCFRNTTSIFDDVGGEFLTRIDGWFNKSYNTISEHAKLSDVGKSLFTTFKECAYD